MSRNHRIDPLAGWHHVTNHAVAGEDLFRTDRDRRQFIRRLNEAASKYEVSVLAFCLMGNHFHLVLHCPHQGLSSFMHYLESTYAREFNMRHGRRGALFAHGFYNKLIASEGQAVAAIRYVERNPLELGIDITTYPWSSYPAHVHGSNELFDVDPHVLENLLGGAAEHRRLVETDFPSDKARMSDGVRQIIQRAPTSVEASLAQLCEIASRIWGVDSQEIIAPRARVRNPARLAVSLVAHERRVGFTEETRSYLGHSSAPALRSVVSRARARMNQDADFRNRVGQLRAAWADCDSIAS